MAFANNGSVFKTWVSLETLEVKALTARRILNLSE
jgi:hypothetical protein